MTRWPSASTVSTEQLLELDPRAVVLREEADADAVLPERRQRVADDRADERSGICSRIPAPSPVCASAPAAPRCSRFASAVSPRTTVSCVGTPFRRATNVTPQASCSKAGS